MKVIIWIKENIYSLIIALVGMLGAGFFWSYHRGRIRSLESEKFVERAHREVALIEEQINILEQRSDDNNHVIKALRQVREEKQAQTLSELQDIKGMTNEEIEQAFRALF
jgi:hypothetical protein